MTIWILVAHLSYTTSPIILGEGVIFDTKEFCEEIRAKTDTKEARDKLECKEYEINSTAEWKKFKSEIK